MAVVEHRGKRQAHEILDEKVAKDNPITLMVDGKLISAPLKTKVSESNLQNWQTFDFIIA